MRRYAILGLITLFTVLGPARRLLADEGETETFARKLAGYDGLVQFSVSMTDPNDEHGGGVISCHGTPLAKRHEGTRCRYVILSAAHCFESPHWIPPGQVRKPVTINNVGLNNSIANGSTPDLKVTKHPDWKTRHTDVALVSFLGDCDEGISPVPLRTDPPHAGETCGVRADHSTSFRNVRENGHFRWVPDPRVLVNVVGTASLSTVSPTTYYFEASGEHPAHLIPGDSGSGLLCESEGNLAVTGVLVRAPHFGATYAVESGAAIQWVARALPGLLPPLSGPSLRPSAAAVASH